MEVNSQRQPRMGRDGALSLLNLAIEAMNIAKEVSSITPAKAVFGSVYVLLTIIRDSMVNKQDYVELGLACADVCRTLERGMGGRRLDELSRSTREAVEQLEVTVAEIHGKVIMKKGRNLISRLIHARNDKEIIFGWKLHLMRILQVFNTELALNTNAIVSDMHQNMLKGCGGANGQNLVTQTPVLGESPPSPSRACFGRDELVEKIVGLAENLTPVALVGTGGIGKTSIALTVLHHDRIKEPFGENRRFIRCDQLPASCAHFLSQLSKVTGAGVKNPEGLNRLCPFLSSKEMLIVLDNAESILDPQGTNAEDIYALVEELSRLETICLCITSRISTVPPDCDTLDIPPLSLGSAHDAFYRIYKNDGRPDLTDTILGQLDFHPLSITLLATVAQHNKWDADRLSREWENQRVGILHTQHNKSLAAMIEISLASPMFQELGPEARDLLRVVAFFPRGINENNLDWLFPTVSDITNILDKLCVLSLTYRSNGFVTMLAPLRDYLRSEDPRSSLLLCTAKECYFARLSAGVNPDRPGFGEARWITSEDVNVEHLLDVFTEIDANSDGVWDACANFMNHLYWHKPRLTVLGQRLERLPDDHPSKPQCLVQFSWLFESIGNSAEYKRLLVHALKLRRERGDKHQTGRTLRYLSDANRLLGLYREWIQQGKEALGIYEELGDRAEQAECLNYLAWLFYGDKQLEAAEEAASRAIQLVPDGSDQFLVCQCHRILGKVRSSNGETEMAINHFEVALGIASSFNWHDELAGIHCSLAKLFSVQDRFNQAHAHVEQVKSYAVNNAHNLGHAMRLQAGFWYQQHRLEEAKSEALRASHVYEKLGATKGLERCRALLRDIQQKETEQPSCLR